MTEGELATTNTKLTLAGRSLKNGLFKFRAASTVQDLDRIKDILNGKLYFSTCQQLNDPFEMRIEFELDANWQSRKKKILRTMKNSDVTQKLSPANRLMKGDQFSRRLQLDPKILKRSASKHYDRMVTECFVSRFLDPGVGEETVIFPESSDVA